MNEYPDLIQLLAKTVSRFSDRPAFKLEENITTYRQFWEQAESFAGGLAAFGIEAGDRVAILLPNIPQFVIAYYGILMLGAIAVPINVLFRDHEIHYILEDSECKSVICSQELQEELVKIVSRDETHLLVIVCGSKVVDDFVEWNEFLDAGGSHFQGRNPGCEDNAVVLYTSGTTGHPRGVVLSHRNLSSNALACVEAGVVTSRDICLGVLPFYHSFGQTVVMNTCVASGSLNVMLPKFDPPLVLETILNNRVTIFAAVPTMFKIMVDAQREPMPLPSVRLCLSGGAKLDPRISRQFKKTFNQHIYEGYGLTEAAPVVSFNPMDYRRKIGSVGPPLSGIEVKIVDEQGNEMTPNHVGEICVKGPNVMKGYLNRPEATKEVLRDGMLYTRDIGKIDDDGYLYILDRKGDLIIKGGFNVYPKEIEQVISYHPKVKEVAVIGVPDPVQGEEVKAYITLKPGRRVSKKEIMLYCQEHMAIYKCPKYIVFLRTLPKSSAGRILKRKLFIKRRR